MENKNLVDGVPPEEDFAPAPRKPPGPFQLWPEKRFVLGALSLGIACFLVSLISWSGAPDLYSASGERLWRQGEYWRLFTSMLVHGDFSHWGYNLLPLLFFGWMLRAYFGFWVFPVVSVLVGMASMGITVAIYDPATRLIGASGMVYGMIAMWLVLYMRFDRDNRFPTKMMRVVGFMLMMLFPQFHEESTSHLAHAAGFVLGGLSGLALLPVVKLRSPPIPSGLLLQRPRRSSSYARYPRIRRTYVEPAEPSRGDARIERSPHVERVEEDEGSETVRYH